MEFITTIPSKMTNKRSANGLTNAIAFQYAAAILIFIIEMRNAKAIGVEDTDDIRVVLKDGMNIYAQAKSSLEPDPLYIKSHLSTDIKDSLTTLYENRGNNTKKLISIFNYHNPFGKPPKFNDAKHTVRSYNDLTSDLKEKLKSYCNNDQESLNKLEFWFLRFEDSNDPFVDLISIVDEHIRRIDPKNIHTKDLVVGWRSMMENNARNKLDLIDFNYMLGSIVNHVLVNAIKFDEVYEITETDEIDFASIDKISQLFSEKFRNLVSFQEYVIVLSSYTKFKKSNPTLMCDKNLLLKEFSNHHCPSVDLNVRKMFEDEVDPDMMSVIYSKTLTIAYAMKSDVIRKVKEVFGYED